MDKSPIFEVSRYALAVLNSQFQEKEVVFVYENITHDGGDEVVSDVYHLYIFTIDNNLLNYYTTSFEKKHVPSDKLGYPEAVGLALDESVPIQYIQGIVKRVSNYFDLFLDHPQVAFVLEWLEKLLHK